MTVAVILGAAVQSDGTPSPTLRRRALHAVEMFRQGRVTHVICCGGLGRFPPREAEVMRRICREEGVPDAAILLEDQSHTTLENLGNIRPILADLDQPEILIVTDGYHKWRALLTARHFGFGAQVACPAMSGTAGRRVVKSWLREIPALIYYLWRLRGSDRGQPSG
ncbi:YdcF family protein [Pseudophaeobacter arcticus]|uniref:YdcF family protein n=1 Tax=Pseudophaeobacter arcticus TaxID=385492 RepID=UPI0003FC165E|nr:YdcF family protein [Pseudophaeobacter arcticus]